MRNTRRTLFAGSLITMVVALVSLIRCDSVPLTATAGSELSISANPSAIPALNGVSTITVTGFKSADDGGGTLPDGTQIFFTTNVGFIEERVDIQNGVARGFLRSNGRAGLATVEARSGAGITATLANPVLIGNATGINILVTANPATVGPPDFTSRIVATVFDNDNNALSDVPLVFSTTAGNLASESSILRTNELGQTSDRLTLENESSATVTATSGTVTGSTTVSRGTVLNPIVSSVFPSSGAPGDTLNVTITGSNFLPGGSVSFGQGIAINNVNYISSTELRVSITIDQNARVETQGRTVTVTNPDGSSGSLSDAFLVITPGAAPSPQITSVSPPSSGARDPVTVNLTINGTDFQNGATVGFSPGGIVVNSVIFGSSTQLSVTITVDITVAAGTSFSVTVINPDGGTGSLAGGYTAS